MVGHNLTFFTQYLEVFMPTLSEIAQDLGVSVQTMRNRINAFQEQTGQDFQATGKTDPLDARRIVYPQGAVDLLLTWLDPDYQPGATAAVEVTVETGNHCSTLDKPDMDGAMFNLEQFRADDVEVLVFDDPAAIADQFISVADRLVQGMDTDIKQREQRLRATRAAQNKVAEKAQELKLEQRLYRDRTRDLDTAQTDETQALQDSIEALRGLRKPLAEDADAS
jgi:predicted transcriptional regulator